MLENSVVVAVEFGKKYVFPAATNFGASPVEPSVVPCDCECNEPDDDLECCRYALDPFVNPQV